MADTFEARWRLHLSRDAVGIVRWYRTSSTEPWVEDPNARWVLSWDGEWRWGAVHVFWNGPNCLWRLGPLRFQWNNPDCPVCWKGGKAPGT